jgi:hypothetical protein
MTKKIAQGVPSFSILYLMMKMMMMRRRARITLACMGRMTKYMLVKKSEGKKPF